MKKIETIPAISIIAPTYNFEKYIAEFLESILNQTLQDYELILIDDCSTDRTVEIIEKFAPSFENLQLIRRRENFGSGGYIRNEFIKYARGEYILNLDADDILLPDALENFFSAAEKYHADFVCTEKIFLLDETENNTVSLLEAIENPVEQITLEQLSIAERVDMFSKSDIFPYYWNKIVRRDFLLRNGIKFSDIPLSPDWIYTFKCTVFAEKFVRIPTIANVYRVRADSLSRDARSSNFKKGFPRYVENMVKGMDELENFMSRLDFFVDNPEMKLVVLNMFFNLCYRNNFQPWSKKIAPEELALLLDAEFRKYPNALVPLSTLSFIWADQYLGYKE